MKLKKSTVNDFITYGIVIVAFVLVLLLQKAGATSSLFDGMLVPACAYIMMAISLNLTVGIMGELSLGHAGFMSVGAFSGVIASQSLIDVIPNGTVRLIVAILIGALLTAVAGFLIGIPVLRLKGDYLAIVTLAFGEIIKNIVNCLVVGVDKNGLHILFNGDGTKTVTNLHLLEGGKAIIKGAQGATGTRIISSFPAGFLLVLIALIVVLNYTRSSSGRVVMAIRDNRIAAESVGINVTRYKMVAFVLSAAIAGAAGTLYGLSMPGFQATKFDFNTSILILVYVVFGGLGNFRGSVIAATVLHFLPQILKLLLRLVAKNASADIVNNIDQYRMLIYSIVLILVMLFTNNQALRRTVAKPIRSLGKLIKNLFTRGNAPAKGESDNG